jgi:elongation factor P
LISTGDFKRGKKIEIKGAPHEIVEFQHIKMGRGGAVVKVKVRNMKTSSIFEVSFKAGEKVNTPNLDEKEMQYLYKQDDLCYFMDTESYEQFPLTVEQLGDSYKFLKENMLAKVLYCDNEPLAVEIPLFVELKIEQTDPGFKGDTASGGSKPAVLETGATVKVPFHINEGDTIKVDTRTSEYIERVK